MKKGCEKFRGLVKHEKRAGIEQAVVKKNICHFPPKLGVRRKRSTRKLIRTQRDPAEGLEAELPVGVVAPGVHQPGGRQREGVLPAARHLGAGGPHPFILRLTMFGTHRM